MRVFRLLVVVYGTSPDHIRAMRQALDKDCDSDKAIVNAARLEAELGKPWKISLINHRRMPPCAVVAANDADQIISYRVLALEYQNALIHIFMQNHLHDLPSSR